MSEEMKPCPFCGGEAEMLIGMHHFSDAKVSCKNCSAESGLFDESEGFERSDELAGRNADAAAKAWNTRTPPPGYVMVPEEKFTAAEKLLSAGMSGAISAETAMLGIQDVLTAARAGEK